MARQHPSHAAEGGSYVIGWKDLKERRIIQMVLAYVAVGWVMLDGADQLVGRELLPELFYRLALVLYLGGIPAALIIGWYHGERGNQKVTGVELGLLGGVLLVTSAVGAGVWRDYRTRQLLAASIGLDSAYDPRHSGRRRGSSPSSRACGPSTSSPAMVWGSIGERRSLPTASGARWARAA